MNHAQLVAAIIEEGEKHDLWCWPTPRSYIMVAGWVDIVLLGSRGAIFCEAKSEDGRRTRAQVVMANRLMRAGLMYRLWRPTDLPVVIPEELERIA